MTERFGKYLLLDKIGSGGMAELFLAKQSGMKGFEKMLAIKRILPHLTQDGDFIRMFIDEAKLAALLTHQNIVQIFDLGHVENLYYIAMEYVMGKDLRAVLQRVRGSGGPLSVSQSLLIVSQVSAGLDYAHRKKDLEGHDLNLVHRDISPQNILISYEGEVKLVDFGIAKAASQASETRTGILKGKLAYMAPEQAWGRPVDRRTDIFALGVVLYECLTGRKLFRGDSEFDTLERVREARVEPLPTALNAEVSPELEQILLKALARDPGHRYQSAAEFQTTIERHISNKGYDFSAVRLAQQMQVLFQDDMDADTSRFRLAQSGAPNTTGAADAATLLRPPHPGEMTPSRPSGSTRSRLATRARRTPAPPSPKRPSLARLLIFCLAALFLGATWLVSVNAPLVRALVHRYPATDIAIEQLRRWPGTVADAIASAPAVQRFLGVPEPDLSAAVPRPPLREVAPVPAPSIPPAFAVDAPFPTAVEDEPAAAGASEPRALTDADRDEIRRLLDEAKQNYDRHRMEEVDRALRRIIEINPRVPAAYQLLGKVSLERNDPEGAIRILEEAAHAFPRHARLHYDLGFLYFSRGVASLAREELQRALEVGPNEPEAAKARSALEQLQREMVRTSEPEAPPP